jgi:AmmeMemoRadiSam system protein A/AmmeMemoRadiSam system protein B
MGILAAIMVPHPPLIIPEVGRGQEKEISSTISAYREAAGLIASAQPETLVVLTPHSVMYRDWFHISPSKGAKGDFGSFRAPKVKLEVSYDTDFVEALCKEAKEKGLPAGTEGERDNRLDHGAMIPLYFIREACSGSLPFKVVRIGLSGLDLKTHYELGKAIKRTADRLGRRVAVIASGDLSHKLLAEGPYGFAPEGPEYDRRIMDVMSRAAFDELFDFGEGFCDKAAECGHRSFVIMSGCFDGVRVKARRLSYEGPFGVGYGVCTFVPEEHSPHVRLALDTIDSYVRYGIIKDIPEGLPREFYKERAGVFVSLHMKGELRGCIGTIMPTTDCLAAEIIRNAISASTEDPRFNPVTKEELELLECSVDVLGEIEDIDLPGQLDVLRYGVIVTKGRRRGLLLPNLEGVDSVEQQIEIAMRKAGIYDSQGIKLQRFEVVRHY